MKIKVNIKPLEANIELPYLGRTITYNNSDWEALYINLRKSQRRWGVVEKVLGKMGEPIKLRAIMYKALFQEMLLYGSESWVVTDAMMTVLEGFHHRIARRIAGMTERKV